MSGVGQSDSGRSRDSGPVRVRSGVASRDSGRSGRPTQWPMSYCLAQVVYQRRGRAILSTARKANGYFMKASRSVSSMPMAVLTSQRPFYKDRAVYQANALYQEITKVADICNGLRVSCEQVVSGQPILALTDSERAVLSGVSQSGHGSPTQWQFYPEIAKLARSGGFALRMADFMLIISI